MHRRIVEDTANRTNDNLTKLPTPFKTIIPNAAKIAEATESIRPASFRAKYTPQFAGLYAELCREIVQRVEWRPRAVEIPSERPARVGGATRSAP